MPNPKLPLVLCDPVPPLRPGDPETWRFWRPWCRTHHSHGAGPGHRLAHCHEPNSPFNPRGYILKLNPS